MTKIKICNIKRNKILNIHIFIFFNNYEINKDITVNNIILEIMLVYNKFLKNLIFMN